MKKTICVLTATRAEYGLLKPLIAKLAKVPEFELKIVVTGMHLSPEFGLTYKEIEQDGFVIDKKIEILLSADSPTAVSKSMGLAMISFADYFSEVKPDMLVVLGDRYETLAVAMVAMNERVAITHIHGGETTEGAVDEAVRHSLTKLSYLHFASTEVYRKRIVQLGEHPERVFNVGALGVENILNEKLLTKSELENSLNINLDKAYAVATFHPVTLENNSAENQIKTLLDVCQKRSELNFIFTKANADADGRIINQMIDLYAKENANIFAFTSLGLKRYLSALKYAEFVIGNSSSGLIEAPSFYIPTINIGDRQKGRIMAESVVNCKADAVEIEKAIDKALSSEFKQIAKNTVSPYGKGESSEKIVTVMKEYLLENEVDLKKKFYDLEF